MRDEFPRPTADDVQPFGGTRRGTVGPKTLTLRVMATTDLHIQLLGFDYVADKEAENHGLAGIATLISEARDEARALGYGTLLLDNGDLLQGTALGDRLARDPVGPDHPLVGAVNYLGYDAIGLGNHDLDHGKDYLRAVTKALRMPVICSNLRLKKPGNLRRSAILNCPLPDGGTFAVSLVSVLPEQTAVWNCHNLGPQDSVMPLLQSVQGTVTRLRAQGAEAVVLMAHLGIRGDRVDDAVHLAEVEGVDALITGHTHRRFPGKDHTERQNIDPSTGLLANRPAVMPGHNGSDLGILDLALEQASSGKWQIIRHKASLKANGPDTKPDPKVQGLCLAAHSSARQALRAPVARTWTPIHNFFSLAMPTPTCAFLARAKARVIREALQGSPEADLPLVAAAPAHTAGGRAGPHHYLHVPEGPILRRHVHGLAPYADQIWALKIPGRGLRAWLERSAEVFNRLAPGHKEQALLNPDVPTFNFDTIYGLSYRIDPTQPAGARISALRYAGAPVDPEQSFVLVTNQFRAAGGGGHRTGPSCEVIHRSPVPIEEALIDSFQNPFDRVFEDFTPWCFSCKDRVEAILETAPAALQYLQETAHLSPVVRGRSTEGFATLRLTL
ncbi:MAG: hypothetical protein HKN30_05110 [Sulfitobacter sp.]|nr:hypothetical protein [Sulfitobacter sp.]